MTAEQSQWTAQQQRDFKEILYRFMGEVHATKAAMYLAEEDGSWQLAAQYGFARRDHIEPTLPAEHTLVRMVRAFDAEPRFYNAQSEVGEVADYLAAAGSQRLMLVPLVGPEGLLGFVDVRDKGQRQPFSEPDRELARVIGGALASLVTAADPDDAIDTDQVEDSTVDPGVGGDGFDEADRPEGLLDDAGIDELLTAAADGLADPRVVAVALSTVGEGEGAMIVYQRSGTPVVDLDVLIKHQVDAAMRARVAIPDRSAWRTEVRRIAGDPGGADQPVIATAVVLRNAASSLTASVVADRPPQIARQALERLAVRAATAREGTRLRITRRGLARRLLQPGDRRYPELVAHSLGVSRLCWSIARVLELDETETERAALAGLLHDVGMRELDYDRLYMHPTPGPEDRRTYRMHVEVGDRIVRVEGFEEIADAVRHHHERWDGNGYPDRLAADEIPLLARIVHVAEVFDLFTAANSYRPAVNRERALAILERAAAHQFDPTVVEAIGKVVA
jgi:putative nucleotidyltransferase with HDIG domain